MADPRSELFALTRSAVIQAGAGTGKTHSLVTLCLHQLGGVGREAPLPPRQLWAVTFTEKAAAELQGRLRQRVDALVRGGSEPALEESCAALGLPLPTVAVWRRVRRDLGLAQMGTLHALCAQILRRHAAAAGLDPAFEQADEARKRALLREACARAVLQSLDGAHGQESAAAARRLCSDTALSAAGAWSEGVAEQLAGVLTALGESGKDPLALAENGATGDVAAARAAELAAREGLAAAFTGAEDALRRNPAAAKLVSWQKLAAAAAAFAQARPSLRACAPGELASVWPALSRSLDAMPTGSLAAALKADVNAVAGAFDALLEAEAGIRAAQRVRDLGRLAANARALLQAEKERLGLLDFDDLTRLCRDLLTGNPAVRAAERAQLGVLLVDEFQDTSRTQLELIHALTSPDPESGETGRPLAIVGDRKQSIYEFRGADVAGAQSFARRLLEAGAQRHVLRISRRSRPALVAFANRLFAHTLAAGEHDFDTPFSPEDDALEPHRPAAPEGPCAELLDVSGRGVDEEAEAVARRICALLADGAPERVFERAAGGQEEQPRRIRGGDIAILLRRFTNLDAFRRALLRRRIPHLVYKGRGFHAAREVQDLVALLGCAADPDDALSLAAVLRSAFGPVSDDGLVLLARAPRTGGAPGRGLSPGALADEAVLSALDARDREGALRAAALVASLRRELDRLGPASLLEAALADSAFAAACAGGLYGEQAAANLDKLVGLARAAELRGESTRAFTASLRKLAADGEPEANAAVVEESDPHAVRLLTVHAAKGLEFPVVIVPECGAPAVESRAVSCFVDPALQLAVSVVGLDGRRRFGPAGAALVARREARQLAESRRLFYVAATRARDRLVLAARAGRSSSWRACLDAVADDARRDGLLLVLPEGGPAPERPAEARAPAASFGELEGRLAEGHAPGVPAQGLRLRAVRGARGEAPAPLSSTGTLVAPVTQLADAAACPRRYRLLHELRLDEHPEPEPGDDFEVAGAGEGPRTDLGSLAHRLLERVRFDLSGAARRSALESLLRAEGAQGNPELIEQVEGFLDSELGRRMASASPRKLHRELPFALHLAEEGAPALVVKGQLDALLLEDGEALVIDYKLSRAREPSRYRAQLEAYALAARELTSGHVRVRTGLVFLRTRGAPFVEVPVAEGAPGAQGSQGSNDARATLLGAARAIARGRETGTWDRIEPARCRALGCGFLQRCHRAPEPGAPQ